MVLRPVFYLADFMSGNMLGPTLPLENVSLNSSLNPGRFSASLDMRKVANSFKEAKGILDLMREGKTTLAPVLEGLNAGTASPLTSRVMGEWWISDIDTTFSDPIVRISGPEFEGYAKEIQVTAAWQGEMDAFLVLRDMLREMTRTSQNVHLSLGTALAGFTVPVDIRNSQTDYWSAIQSLQDGGAQSFEWRIQPSLGLDGITPYTVGRTLRMGSPTMRTERLGIALELKTPGTDPASLIDMDRSWSESAVATTIYGFGAGSGEDQIKAWTSRPRPPGEPGKSRLITVRDALTYGQVKRATAAALAGATPEQKVFPVVMPTGQYLPTISEVYTFLREPSWSMPEAFEGRARCVGWSWSSPRPGQPDVFTVQLVDD